MASADEPEPDRRTSTPLPGFAGSRQHVDDEFGVMLTNVVRWRWMLNTL